MHIHLRTRSIGSFLKERDFAKKNLEPRGSQKYVLNDSVKSKKGVDNSTKSDLVTGIKILCSALFKAIINLKALCQGK